MSSFNKVNLSLQKIKSKSPGQNQVNLVNYLVKDYGFTNDEVGTLIDQAVQTNVIPQKNILQNCKIKFI